MYSLLILPELIPEVIENINYFNIRIPSVTCDYFMEKPPWQESAGDLDDVLTSNTSKYIQYIGPVNSACIGKIWMYCFCIKDVSVVSDVFKIVFGMYCLNISDVLEFRINGSLQAF